jgi:hypothetical protein
MSFNVLGFNHYSCAAGDIVTYTATATGIPCDINILRGVGGIVVVQSAAPGSPTETRRFTMPATNDHFTASYGFGPNPPANAEYTVTISGPGGQDGPFKVRPSGFPRSTLQYNFDLLAAAPLVKGMISVGRAAPAGKKAVKKQANAVRKVAKKAAKKTAATKKVVKKAVKTTPRRRP